jgi:hypothetical protein
MHVVLGAAAAAHTHTHTLARTLTHTHAHTHTHTHTRAHTHTHARTSPRLSVTMPTTTSSSAGRYLCVCVCVCVTQCEAPHSALHTRHNMGVCEHSTLAAHNVLVTVHHTHTHTGTHTQAHTHRHTYTHTSTHTQAHTHTAPAPLPPASPHRLWRPSSHSLPLRSCRTTPHCVMCVCVGVWVCGGGGSSASRLGGAGSKGAWRQGARAAAAPACCVRCAVAASRDATHTPAPCARPRSRPVCAGPPRAAPRQTLAVPGQHPRAPPPAQCCVCACVWGGGTCCGRATAAPEQQVALLHPHGCPVPACWRQPDTNTASE